jgi:hypothetical protein
VAVGGETHRYTGRGEVWFRDADGSWGPFNAIELRGMLVDVAPSGPGLLGVGCGSPFEGGQCPGLMETGGQVMSWVHDLPVYDIPPPPSISPVQPGTSPM